MVRSLAALALTLMALADLTELTLAINVNYSTPAGYGYYCTHDSTFKLDYFIVEGCSGPNQEAKEWKIRAGETRTIKLGGCYKGHMSVTRLPLEITVAPKGAADWLPVDMPDLCQSQNFAGDSPSKSCSNFNPALSPNGACGTWLINVKIPLFSNLADRQGTGLLGNMVVKLWANVKLDTYVWQRPIYCLQFPAQYFLS